MLPSYSIWRLANGTLHLSEGQGYPRDEYNKHIEGVTSKQYSFNASTREEAEAVLEKAVSVWRVGSAGVDISFRNDLEEARIRDMDYSTYLPLKDAAARDLIKKAYARAIADGTRMGFTDSDWEDANQLADKLLAS